ncbi:PA14 domain-containing protein [Terribacillus saccharophilus]|uniref:PA14 domain-containing protein n=1 Tax=Terribacillus saccharophilus TaxID=361277 RepID=UPI003D28DCBF
MNICVGFLLSFFLTLFLWGDLEANGAESTWSEKDYVNFLSNNGQQFHQRIGDKLETVNTGKWLAYYYDNTNLNGTPVYKMQVEGKGKGIEQNLGTSSPVPNKVPVNNFSVRYVTQATLSKGQYVFNISADDGYKVYLDGELVVDHWDNNSSDAVNSLVEVSNTLNQSDKHWIEIVHRDKKDSSNLSFNISSFNESSYIGKGNWLAQYYTNKYYKGSSLLESNLKQVNYNWGTGSPNSSIPKDYFSARFSKQISGSNDYYVQTFVDDGIKLKIDGKAVIDRTKYSSKFLDTAIVTNIGQGTHKVEADYIENSREAFIFADVVPFGDWVGYYYNNTNLEGTPDASKVIEGDGKSLSFDIGYGSPMSGINKDHFSASFSTAQKLESGHYKVNLFVDNGFRMYIDDKLVLDRWNTSNYKKEETTVINVPESSNGTDVHKIRLEYKEGTNEAFMNFKMQPLQDTLSTKQWISFYYPNQNLKETSKGTVVETSTYLDKYWGNGSPSGIPSDHFTGKSFKKIAGGKDYFIHTLSDDGVRVKVDGKTYIDKWTGSWGQTGEALLTGLSSGDHTVEANYREVRNQAYYYADVIPVGQWKAYYFNNTKASGDPIKQTVISDNGLNLNRDYGTKAPMSGVNKDKFSTKYVTAQEIKAGKYTLRAKADDGIRVYVDGKKVIDSWKNSKYREEAITLDISNKKNVPSGQEDIHFIEVESYEYTNEHKVDISLESASKLVPTNGDWVAEFYKVKGQKGNAVLVGGNNSLNKLTKIAYDWGTGSPHSSIPKDYFSARFSKQVSGSTDYYAQTFVDDGIQLNFDGKAIIDRTKYSSKFLDSAIITNVGKGSHTVEANYIENSNDAFIYADVVPFGDWVGYYYNNTNLEGTPDASKVIEGDGKSLSFDLGYGSPMSGINKDHFTASFSTAQKLESGHYKVNLFVDNGFRMYIDDKLILDRWNTSNYKKEETTVINVPESSDGSNVHKIRLEYREGTNEAFMNFKMQPLQDTLSTKQWISFYYPNQDLKETSKGTVVETSTYLDKYWGNGSPSGIPSDHFTGKSFKKIAGGKDYFIHTLSDDGVRVKVDGKTYIDKWTGSWGQTGEALLTGLSSGDHTVEANYREVRNQAYYYADVIPVGQWKAYYFNNTKASGDPIKQTVISDNGLNLNRDYGTKAPMSGVNKDKFSTKYVTAQEIKAGKYTLRAKADDGIRVYVDGKKVIDNWDKSKYREEAITLDISNKKNVPSGQEDIHFIEVESFEHTNEHKVDISMESADDLIPTNGDWVAEFYNNTNLTGNAVLVGGNGSLTNLSEIDYDWGKGSPHRLINEDNFSVRAQKIIEASADGEIALNALANDGIRIYVNNKKVIDKWSNGTHDISTQLPLKKGKNIIKVEYYEKSSSAFLQVGFNKTNTNYETNKYNYSFDSILDKQMALKNPPPQTDSGGYWHAASRSEVAYYLNPKNFSKDSSSYFQFMKLSGNANLNVTEVNEQVLKGKGSLAGKASAYIKAGKDYNVNEVYLLAHSLLESGNGTSKLATGQIKVNGKKVYNMYGIGAVDSNAEQAGAQYAYNQGWFTVEAAIAGGAKWIKEKYIDQGQDTLYEMRWNPERPATHQYATDIGWAVKQTARIDKVYKLISNYNVTFEEPVYSNQPSAGTNPGNDSGSGSNAETSYPDNVIGYPTTSLNFRSGPSTSYGTIGSLNTNSKLEILGQNSNGWLQVKADGKTGWVSGSYVTIKNLLQVDLDSGTLNVRSGASTSSSSVGALSNGEYVAAVLDSNENRVMENGFSKIYYNNGTAYVYSTYVNVK